MKRILLFITTTCLLLISCKKELDKSNIDSVINYSISNIKKGDFIRLLELSIIDTTKTFPLVHNLETNIHDSIVELKNYEKIKFIKYELLTERNSYEDIFGKIKRRDSIPTNKINYYFTIDNSYYELKTTYKILEDEFIYNSIYFKNLTADCENDRFITRLIKESNAITSVEFKKIIWTSSRDMKTFVNFKLRGVNNYDSRLERLKFKLILFNNDDGVFFTRTISKDLLIEPGDTFEIEISELKDYYCGFRLEKGSFNFDVVVLSVEPLDTIKSAKDELNLNSCNKIKELSVIESHN